MPGYQRSNAPDKDEAFDKLILAARQVRDELDVWEPTERSRAQLNNALLDVEQFLECNGPRDCIGTERGCRHC